jgi:hypothetical protein
MPCLEATSSVEIDPSADPAVRSAGGVLPSPARSRCSRPSLPARRLGRIRGLARPNIGTPLEGEALGAAGWLMN